MSMRPGDPYPAQPAVVRAPDTVRLAATLLFAVVGVLAVRAVLTYVLFDSLLDNFAEGRGEEGQPRELIEDRAPQYKPLALVNVVVFGGLLSLCGAFVLRGAGWARITATVVGVLGLLGGLISILQPATAVFKLLGLLVTIGLAAAVVLLWLAPSSAYFRDRKRR
jgi:hypothetical protein